MTTNVSALYCDPCVEDFFHIYSLILPVPSAALLPVVALVFWTKASSPLTVKTDILTINLLFTDFLLSLFTIIIACSLFLHSPLYMYAYSAVLGLLTIGHPLGQCFMCLERYTAVKYPIVFLKYRPLRYRFALLGAIWVVVIVVSCTMIGICFTDPRKVNEYLAFECVFLVTLVTINSYSCFSILRMLIQPSPGDKIQNGTRKNRGHDVKRKAFYLVVGVEMNLLCCYLPPIVIFLLLDEAYSVPVCTIFIYNIWFIELGSVIHSLMHLNSQGNLKFLKGKITNVQH